MNKPISVILEDAKQSIVKTINELQLHPSLLEPIIKELYIEVQQQATIQYQKEKAEYEKSLKKEKESNK